MAPLRSLVSWAFTFRTCLGYGFRLNDGYKLPAPQGFPQVSVEGNDLYVTDADGTKTALSTGLSDDRSFTGLLAQSADNKYAIAWQVSTLGDNRTLTLVQSSPPGQIQPQVIHIPYPVPGDAVRMTHPRLFDLEAKRQINIANDWIGNNTLLVTDALWNFQNHTYRYLIGDRASTGLRMVEIDTNGNSRILVDDYLEKGIDTITKPAWGFLNQTEQMWWLSERNGWNSLYLVNTTWIPGQNKPSNDSIRQLTPNGFDVSDVVWVNEKEQIFYILAFGMVEDQNPYHIHLARINYDGTGFKVLTAEGDGYHGVKFIDDNTFEDYWSRVDLPMRAVVRDINGKQIRPMDYSIPTLDNVTTPERFSAPGRDGKTAIWGIIVHPKTFDPNKRYRVLEWVYTSPMDQYVVTDFSTGAQLELAQYYQKNADDLDVIVVMSDGMGTSWRGREFRDVVWHNLQDYGFADRMAWLKAAAATRPYMDIESGVGIYGTSAGAQAAMWALIAHSDFYTAAVCDSGSHDNRVDKLWWNELILGYPVDPVLYDAASNVVHAHEMNGSLLLLMGELDTNVDPACTLQVVNALNEAGKDFDFMIVPGADHGEMWRPHVQLQNKIKRFWKNWMAGNGLG